MRIGKFEHKPSLVIVLLYILFAAMLLSLGTWQMQRAATKTAILDAAAHSLDEAAIHPDQIDDVLQAGRAHTQVTFNGLYQGERQFLWDNRVHKGQAGFEVITPVNTGSGIVLVNRGWVAPGLTRQDLPDVSLSNEIKSATVTINGLFSRPSKGFASGDAFDKTGPWPRVMQYFDYAMIEKALGSPVLAGVIQPQIFSSPKVGGNKTDPAIENSRKGESDADDIQRPDYYMANWEPIASIGPARHYGYAFQWYAMAAALTILYIVYNTKRIKPGIEPSQ